MIVLQFLLHVIVRYEIKKKHHILKMPDINKNTSIYTIAVFELKVYLIFKNSIYINVIYLFI